MYADMQPTIDIRKSRVKNDSPVGADVELTEGGGDPKIINNFSVMKIN